MKKRTQCLWLILSLVLSLCPVQTEVASAAATPKLSKNTVTFTKLGVTKKVKVKNIKASKVKSLKVRNSDESVVTVIPVSSTVFNVYSTGEGKATIKVALKLWKPLSKKKKKKSYTFKLTAVVDLPPVTPSASPSATPTVTPPPSATPTVTPPPSATPTVTPPPTASTKPTATPTGEPSASPTATSSSAPSSKPLPAFATTYPKDEEEVYERILATKSFYPQGFPWSNDDYYQWTVTSVKGDTTYVTRYGLYGCAAIASILSDVAFGTEVPFFQINNPAPESIRVGDIIRMYDNTPQNHSAMVIGTDGDQFTLVEGNVMSYEYDYQPVIYWGRKIPKTSPIDYIWTRWRS